MQHKTKEFFLYFFIGALLMLIAHLMLYLLNWVGAETQTLLPSYLFLYPAIYTVTAFVLAHRERWARRLLFVLLAPVYYWLWNYLQDYDRQLNLPFIMKSIQMIYVLGVTFVCAFALGYIRNRKLAKANFSENENDDSDGV